MVSCPHDHDPPSDASIVHSLWSMEYTDAKANICFQSQIQIHHMRRRWHACFLPDCVACGIITRSHIELFPPLSSRDIIIIFAVNFSCCGRRVDPPSFITLSISSVLPERVLLMLPFGKKPHLFVNYAININKTEEAFMVSLPEARDVSWHHHASDDWWKLSGCISCSGTLEENGVVIKRYYCEHGCVFLIGTIWDSGAAHRIIQNRFKSPGLERRQQKDTSHPFFLNGFNRPVTVFRLR